MSNTDELTRDQLVDRLAAAESVCLMFGWTGIDDSPRDKAAHELWLDWLALSGVDPSPHAHPELSEDRIAFLAAKRDATRARLLKSVEVTT